LRADVAKGRLALGALFAAQRLRGHRENRIEGFPSLANDMFAEPETPRGRVRLGRDPGAIRTRDPQLRSLTRSVIHPRCLESPSVAAL